MSKTLMTVPLSQLQRAKDNVRKTESEAEIETLAASIEAHGLLQNLAVRQLPANGKEGRRYEVVAGGRRLQALRLLVRRKKLEKDFGVPCRLVEAEVAGGLEVSLAENVVRVALHPADQFEAFSQLQAQGLGAADIAARFGVSQRVVEQRLKLAAVSPRLMAEYKDGRMALDQLTAFTVSDDHAAQEHVWFEAPLFDRRPEALRRALTKTLVEGSDRRARFVGAEAYEAAGGTVVRDLFDEEAAYFADSQLLDRLVTEKLQATAEDVRQEGWSWVEVQPELDYEALARFGRASPKKVRLSRRETRRLKNLSERYDTLVSELEDQADQKDLAALDTLSKEIDQLARKGERWTKKDLGRAGAILSLTSSGTLQVTRGLLRQERVNERTPAGARVDERSRDEGRGKGHSEALLRDLSAHRTAALREMLAEQPELALTALVHALALRVFFGAGHETCVDVRPVALDLAPLAEGIGESVTLLAMAERHVHWGERLSQAETVWPWLIQQPLETKLELLAYLVACTVNAVHRFRGDESSDQLAQADVLADAAALDMARWWRPTAASYFDRVSKEQIVQAISEGVSPDAAESVATMKKRPMAAKAEEWLAATRWLPSPLRCGRAEVVDRQQVSEN